MEVIFLELNVFSSIFIIILILFVQYVIIETAVRRGIDVSETKSILEEIAKKIKELDSDDKEEK